MRYKIEIIINDVTRGDVKGVVEDLLNDVGPDFDVALGDFAVSTFEQHDHETGWFPYNSEEEV